MTSSGTMEMVFQNSHMTPLFSSAWTPQTSSQYAGTCIFLVILATILRALFALKTTLDRRAQAKARNRRYVKVQGRGTEGDKIESNRETKSGAVLTVNGVEEDVKVVTGDAPSPLPFRLSVDLPRATLVTVMAGVGYLLMLAVMTMNVGYFLSVLTGVFAGDLAVGRYGSGGEH